jgi:ribosomal protein L11 methyltransferase
MYLWRKLVSQSSLTASEEILRSRLGNELAVIERPGRKRLVLEAGCKSRWRAHRLVSEFGGYIEKLPRDWQKRFARQQISKPLKVGKRLIISNGPGTSVSSGSSRRGALHLIIPAGAAFGTGDHVTTAMSLRILEEITRKNDPGWSMLDVGTGSGIFALVAKCFGAARVIGLDVDPVAVSVARTNARLNKIGGTDFRAVDVRAWRSVGEFDIIMANLFSELLVQILPVVKTHLRVGGWLILSGVLRREEHDFIRALKANNLYIPVTRRSGRWIAVLACLR